MKIQSNTPGVDAQAIAAGIARSEDRRATSGATSAGGGGESGTVRIGQRASLLAAAEASLASMPDIDSARVDEIRRAITEGRFEVDSERVAERLLGSVRDLILTRGN